MWLQLRRQILLHLSSFVLVLAIAAVSSASRMMRGASSTSSNSTTNTTVTAIPSATATDKLLLLNDLSLEQAYLHHSIVGTVPGAAGASASLAQQAARLAAGSYSGTTGQAPGGWRVQATYKNINSVAVMSTRPGVVNEKQACALAFRGSDDRLDWRNDYMARQFPMLLCGEEDEGKERFFLDMLTRADNVEGEEREMEEERRRRGQRRRQTPPPVGDQQVKESGNSTSNNENRRSSSSSSSKQTNSSAPTLPGLRQRCPRPLGLHVLHYGFYQSFRLLSSGTTLADDWGNYFRNGTCDPNVSIITGHSLGGAFTIYASILGWQGVPITFAAPRAVINGSCPTTAGREARATTTTTTMVERSRDEDTSHPLLPITRIYLTDDPVPATLPVSDAMRLGISGPWVHCGCALALQASVPAGATAEEEEGEEENLKKEHFAAKAMGCGSNEPLREAPLLPPPPTLPVLAAVPSPLSLGRNRRGGDDEEEAAVGANGLLPSVLLAPGDLKRHVHTRYIRAMDEACQGPLDSMRCLFDHEV